MEQYNDTLNVENLMLNNKLQLRDIINEYISTLKISSEDHDYYKTLVDEYCKNEYYENDLRILILKNRSFDILNFGEVSDKQKYKYIDDYYCLKTVTQFIEKFSGDEKFKNQMKSLYEYTIQNVLNKLTDYINSTLTEQSYIYKMKYKKQKVEIFLEHIGRNELPYCVLATSEKQMFNILFRVIALKTTGNKNKIIFSEETFCCFDENNKKFIMNLLDNINILII